MAQPFRTTRRVEFRDTDAAGIMHFSTFFTAMEEAEHALLRSLGLSVVAEDAEGAIAWPRVSASCDYRGSVKFEDVLDITVVVGRIGDKSVTYQFAFTSSGRPVAEGQLVAVCCRVLPDGSMKSVSIPKPIVQKLQAHLAAV